MVSKFSVGQKVIVRPVADPGLSLRDSGIEPYVGKPGEVTDFYSISPNPGDVFYIYKVRLGDDNQSVVLHEDELEGR